MKPITKKAMLDFRIKVKKELAEVEREKMCAAVRAIATLKRELLMLTAERKAMT